MIIEYYGTVPFGGGSLGCDSRPSVLLRWPSGNPLPFEMLLLLFLQQEALVVAITIVTMILLQLPTMSPIQLSGV